MKVRVGKVRVRQAVAEREGRRGVVAVVPAVANLTQQEMLISTADGISYRDVTALVLPDSTRACIPAGAYSHG